MNENEQRKRLEIERKLQRDRDNAEQGQFFFAKLIDSYGREIPHPVFILGKHGVSNDGDDVIVCQCTTANKPKRSKYDIDVQLKNPSYVRTNKIFTAGRNQLQFKLPNSHVSSEKIREIINSAMDAISHKD